MDRHDTGGVAVNKTLQVIWGDVVLYDGPVGRLTWTESGSGTAIELKAGPDRAAGLSGLLENLADRQSARRETADADHHCDHP